VPPYKDAGNPEMFPEIPGLLSARSGSLSCKIVDSTFRYNDYYYQYILITGKRKSFPNLKTELQSAAQAAAFAIISQSQLEDYPCGKSSTVFARLS
jgi:hypothetical protein